MTAHHESLINRSVQINKLDLGADKDEATILLCGDTHFGDQMHDKRLDRFVAKWVAQDSSRYVMFVGDLFNGALKDSLSDVYIDKHPQDEYNEAVRWLASVDHGCGDGKHHLIASVAGNHDKRFEKSIGISLVQRAFIEAGDIPLGGKTECAGDPKHGIANDYISINAISIGRDRNYTKSSNHMVHYTFVLWHGKGGGNSDTAPVRMMNNITRICANGDVYVVGHTHRPTYQPRCVPLIDKSRSCLEIQPQSFVSVPSMLMWGGYGAEAGYGPTANGAFPTIWISGKDKLAEYHDVTVRY